MKKENGMMEFMFFYRIHKTFASSNKLIKEMKSKELVTLITIERLEQENGLGRVKVSELVKFLEVPNADISRTLKSLESKNLVMRETDTKDRRNVFVKLTEAGIYCLEENKKICDAHFMKITERMGKEKMDLLWDLMDELGNILKEEAEKIEENTKGQ